MDLFIIFNCVEGRTPSADTDAVEIDSASSMEGGIFLTILVESGNKAWNMRFSDFLCSGAVLARTAVQG